MNRYASLILVAVSSTAALSPTLVLSSLKKPSTCAPQNEFASEAAMYREQAAALRREADAMTDELIRDRKAREVKNTPLALANTIVRPTEWKSMLGLTRRRPQSGQWLPLRTTASY